MRTDFRKSFARDLRRRKNDSDFLDCVKRLSKTLNWPKPLPGSLTSKNLKVKGVIIGFALGITESV